MLSCWSRWCSGWGAATSIVLVACSSDGATFGDGTDSGGDVDGSDDDGPIETATAATADPTVDSTGGEGNADDDGADGATSGGEPADSEGCEQVECGGNGSCVSQDSGPVCMCDEGYAPLGLDCIPCSVPASTDIDLELVTGTIRLTVGELAPPTSDIEDAVLKLRNVASGDEVLLGNTHDGDLPVVALPGQYDVVYSIDSGGVMLPRNRQAVIGKLDLVDEVDEIIDLQVGRLTGAITIAGSTPPNAEFDQGRLWLRTADGDSVLLGSTMYGAYDVRVLPGSYEIRYEHVAGANVPANVDALIGAVLVEPLAEIAVFDIDIPMIALAGDITINGESPPDSAIENGRLTFVGEQPGDVFPLSQTRYGAYEKKVVPGTYRVLYEWVAGATAVPANARAQLPTELVAYEDMPAAPAIDVPVVTVTGLFTLGKDGMAPPADPTDDGNVFLRQGGDAVYLGNTAYGAYERRVIPGSYEIYFGQDSSRGGVPTNTNARISASKKVAGGEMDVAIPFVVVDGSITVGGEAPPSSDYDDGHVYLRNAETLDSVLLANTRESTFSATMVVPGLYDIVYAAETPGGQVPVNAGAVIGAIDLGAESSFAVDVPVLQVAGAISLDGMVPPADASDLAFLFLVDARTLDPVYLGSTAGAGYSRRLTPGDYLVYYRVQQSSGQMPANVNANLGCWTLAP